MALREVIVTNGAEGNPGSNGQAVVRLIQDAIAEDQIYFFRRFNQATGDDDFAPLTYPQEPGLVGWYRVVVPAGTTTFDIVIPFNGDTTPESDESFVIDLYENAYLSGNYQLRGSHSAQILNDDFVSRFSVNDVSINEGSAVGGSTALTFTVSRDNADAAGSVTYSFANVTTDGSDFNGGLPAGGTVSFAAGVFTQTVTVDVSPDFTVEGSETFQINLGTATGGTILDGQGIGTITNDDVAGTFVLTGSSTFEGNSGNTNATFTVTRTGGSADADFVITSLGGTATSGVDYVAPGTLTFSFRNGSQSESQTIAIIGDNDPEADETITLNSGTLSAGGNFGSRGPITIRNDDTVGNVSIANATVVEGNTGTRTIDFTITRANGNAPFSVTASTVDFGSAAAGTDYVAKTQTFAFAANETTKTFSVTVNGDYTVEGNEGFAVQLSGVTNGGTLVTGGGSGNGTATGIITNDDFVGTISASDVSVTEGDSNSVTGFFTITRTGGLAASVVSYAIQPSGSAADTTATAGVDYSAPASGTISFAVGQTSALVPFQVLGDTLVERNETFRIQLTSATNGGIIGRSVGIATIVDNDVPSNTQFGTSGDDTLIAQAPGAVLVGGAGNDIYLVNSSSDQVIEQAGGGADIVYTTVSYNLGVNEVEALSVANQQTTNSINLIGNYASQTIVGNYGDNVLNGGSGGVDTLIGLFGNDTYAVGDSRTVVVEQAGQGFDTLVTSVNYTLAAGVSIETFTAQDRASTTGLRLIGNEVSQTIAGTAGNDTIMGGGGSDTLLGGAGADTFVIGTVASGNVAVLADFVSGTDRIGLSTTAFAGLGTALDANEFVVGSAAVGTNAQIVYNQSTGQLFYDADGTGSGAAVLFAQVVPGTVVNTSAFDMIAPTAMAA